ncbi:MAG: alkaline phosphatase family protein [Opitutae bacterium]|nr:alkaline phosphatase family protein [Opitutae bacterium]
MKLRSLVAFTAPWLLATLLHAAGTLVSGPMLGYSAHREAVIWVETKDAKKVTLDYWLAGKPGTKQTLEKTGLRKTPAGGQISHFRPGLLELGATYEYTLSIDGRAQPFPYPLTFKTKPLWEWRTPPPDFKFIYGSCAYLNEPQYDRPGEPYGKGTEIFRHMAESGADFMLWGGDNWYYREPDFDSLSGLWYRAQHDRATPDLQKLLAVMPNYATWDDHDYGSNDANKSYELKDETLDIFKSYWANPSWGEPGNPGVYGKFFWGDAAFFLMDDRTYRDDDKLDASATKEMKTQYGAKQREWLKQSLLAAQTLNHFTWKFIATGGQVITDFGGASETFDNYPDERADLLEFIRQHKITGVVILSGDVHFTELARKKLTGTQWIYELTSSPFSSSSWPADKGPRKGDPQRIEGTMVTDQNYCVLSFRGPRNDRVLTIACYDKANAKRWEHEIRASELK